jgi:hypothetical protein
MYAMRLTGTSRLYAGDVRRVVLVRRVDHAARLLVVFATIVTIVPNARSIDRCARLAASALSRLRRPRVLRFVSATARAHQHLGAVDDGGVKVRGRESRGDRLSNPHDRRFTA